MKQGDFYIKFLAQKSSNKKNRVENNLNKSICQYLRWQDEKFGSVRLDSVRLDWTIIPQTDDVEEVEME